MTPGMDFNLLMSFQTSLLLVSADLFSPIHKNITWRKNSSNLFRTLKHRFLSDRFLIFHLAVEEFDQTVKNMIVFVIEIQNQIFINHRKKQQTPYFRSSATPGSGGSKIWGLLFFLNNVKIGNSDFITILTHINLYYMIHTTNYCSKPTDNVSGGL